jgi:hypothetical protein
MATGVMFGKFGANILGGETGGETKALDWASDTSKAQLHTSAASFAVDTDEVVADVANEVANGNGYTTGGYTLTPVAPTYNATGNITVCDAGDPTWTASGAGFAASHAVFVGDTAGDGLLIEYLAFDAGTITLATGDTLTINIDATNGLFYVTAI